jgi:hypothetical protein
MKNEILIKAILSINPKAQITVREDIDNIEWLHGTTPIPKADIEAKIAELPTEEEEKIARENLKASTKAKLIAGQPLTEEEADTIVL